MDAGHAPIATGVCTVVTSLLVLTGLKLLPVTCPTLVTVHTPAGSGLLIVTWNIMVTLSPAGMVPTLNVTVSPLNRAGPNAVTRRALAA
jgi:hypothetical protein